MESNMHRHLPNIAVVIPCYKVRKQIVGLIAAIGPEVSSIIVVDDCCPENSGEHVLESCIDPRIKIIKHQQNSGVGGATVTGIKAALTGNVDIVVKLDGDGQYDPALIPILVSPILNGFADAAKGNRFYNLDNLRAMPLERKVGNAGLSFITKLVSGYWNILDPTNGFIAVHANILRQLPLDGLDKRYYFESDLLFRLNISRAVIQDIPLAAFYADETSSLSTREALLSFPAKHARRLFLRLFYNYLLRDFNIGSISLLLAVPLIFSGFLYGALKWSISIQTGVPATAGMVMICAVQLIFGTQLLLTFVNYDVNNSPSRPQYPLLAAPTAGCAAHTPNSGPEVFSPE